MQEHALQLFQNASEYIPVLYLWTVSLVEFIVWPCPTYEPSTKPPNNIWEAKKKETPYKHYSFKGFCLFLFLPLGL